jgi:hypothetical protein
VVRKPQGKKSLGRPGINGKKKISKWNLTFGFHKKGVNVFPR